MDRLEAMASFLAVLEEGGFSAAARRLGAPLTTVSRRVAELEQHLGARLLTRSTRHVAPTEAGQAFAQTARRLLEELGEAERLASGEYQAPRGMLTLAAPVLLGRVHLLPVLAEFLQAYPEVSVDLRLQQREPNLLEEQLDLALTIGAPPDSTLKGLNLGQVRPVIVASPAYLARHGTPATPGELAQHDLITFAGGAGPAGFALRGGRRLTVRPRLLVSTAEAAVDAAIAGMGVAQLLCHQVSPAVHDGRLTTLLREDWGEPMPVQLLHAGTRATPQKVRAFLDFVVPRLRPRLVFEA